MRAVRLDHFGGPDVLGITTRPDPSKKAGEALIAVRAASVNPSDVKTVAGQMEGTVLPRIPGRNFAGVVVEGPSDWVGAEVWGTGGDIGFRRDGSHAEFLAVPEAALVRKPERLGFEEASSSGVHFVTGWLGTVVKAQLAPGEAIAVFGVSGGVGGAVAQIAHVMGAHVIGVDRVHPAAHTPAASVIDAFVALDGAPQAIGSRIKQGTAGQGVSVVFDAVGGVTTAAALASLAHGGRLVVISSVGTRTVEIDLVDLYHNETLIIGCNSADLGVVESSALLGRLTPYFDSGQFRPLPIAERFSLENAQDAYRAVAGHVKGAVVIRP
ncbi:zinc-binding alcohol dehydrogenase family protein [Streptomyces sp. NPDC088354]|uniref:quinone oxidoreductase family protein n=1 Tax=unclassified Streptomyces TaxID=2593676 RepID=UPI0029AE7629|nr:zinc-binding alcohol dehydrogenase family protein [Streptomyces sp. MI02-7b]MDX3078028.1 zinc-binding alcohol dehydrogenase family protein [Streptomyces sp. MI02-7b]